MKRNFKNIYFLILLCLFCNISFSQSKNPYGFDNIDFPNKLIRFGAGTKGGLLYPIAESICKLINKNQDASRIRCVLIETPGAEFNVMALENESFEISITQGDNLIRMTADEEDGPTALRLVSLLGYAPVNLFARKDINSIEDFKGKKYNANAPGTGSAMTGKDFLDSANLDNKDFSSVEYFPSSQIASNFCDKNIDFGIYVYPHPGQIIKNILDCDGKLLSIPKNVLSSMKENIPSSKEIIIPKGVYPKVDSDINSIAVPMVLVSTSNISQEAIFRFVTILKTHYGLVASRLPQISRDFLDLKDMSEIDFNVHDGATRALSISK